MNTYDELKLAIYESFENEYISESEKDFLLDYITEKKTREEYRIASFKKKYDFKPDKPGAKTGTILVNGKRQRVDFEKSDMINIKGFKGDEDSQKNVRQTSANIRDKDSTIFIGDTFFKLKGSDKNSRRDAVLQHEVAHTRLHGLNPNSKVMDKSKMSPLVHKKAVDSLLIASGMDPKSKDINKYMRKELNDATNQKEYKKSALDNTTKEMRSKRNEILKHAEKYDDPKSQHLTSQEVEADRYAANKVSAKALKRGIREISKHEVNKNLSKKRIADMINLQYGDNVVSSNDISDESLKAVKKFTNKNAQRDLEGRSKALKDKKLINSDIYK